MADLDFSIKASVSGSSKDREGLIFVDDQEVRYSVPASMGGKGVGASPETLLLSAVTACYSLTLLAYLQKRRLPYSKVDIKTEGVVTGFPQNDKYAKIIVNPAINGGDSSRQKDYKDAAVEARENCFIGQTVAAGGVAYELGSVTMLSS